LAEYLRRLTGRKANAHAKHPERGCAQGSPSLWAAEREANRGAEQIARWSASALHGSLPLRKVVMRTFSFPQHPYDWRESPEEAPL
jgi:hypothetical protein